MEHLPNFHGVSPVFGVLTNLVEWRVAWLPDEKADKIASQVLSFGEEDDLSVNEEIEKDDEGGETKDRSAYCD